MHSTVCGDTCFLGMLNIGVSTYPLPSAIGRRPRATRNFDSNDACAYKVILVCDELL